MRSQGQHLILKHRANRAPRLGLALAALLVASGAANAQDASRELEFGSYLVYELKYHDTALRHLETIKSKYSDRDTQGDIAYMELDARRPSLSNDEYLEELKAVQRRFPSHSRSSLGSLPEINLAVVDVVGLLQKAKDSSDADEAKQLREQAKKDFTTRVEQKIDPLIEDLNEKVRRGDLSFREMRRGNPRAREPEDLSALRQNRNTAERVRVRYYLVYARMLNGVKDYETERKRRLEKGLEYAATFVEDRPEFQLMQFDTQLQKGLIEFELGLYADAIDSLTILPSIRPELRQPNPQYIALLKELHIQAILFAAKSYNRSGRYEEAADFVKAKLFEPSGDAYDLSQAASDESLEKYHVLAQLESGVSLAGAGEPERGLSIVEGIIKKYTDMIPTKPVARAYVTDARKALGEIVEVSGVPLSARAYYEGGLGLYSELREEEALALFQLGLTSTFGAKEKREVAPLCLDKIGEINFRLGRLAQAAIAYMEICANFPESELVQKAANNAFSAVSKLNRAHAGYKQLFDQAEAFYNKYYGDGGGVWIVRMQEAYAAEQQGQLARAAEIYRDIPEKDEKGNPVPVYWRAKVSLYQVMFQQWMQLDPDTRMAKKDEIQKVAEQLEVAVEKSKEADDRAAAVMGSFVRGQIAYETKEWEDAEKALEPFISEYADDTTYRAPALYFLVDATLSQKDENAAAKAYQALKSDMPDVPSTQYASLLLADYHAGKGTPESMRTAAGYVLDYAKHPSAQEELKDVTRLMDVVDSLIDGGLFDDADKFLKDAEALAGSNGAQKDVLDRIRVRRSRFAYKKQDYRRVIKELTAYISEYDFAGAAGPDDPDIFYMFGDSWRRLNPKNPSTKEMKTAHQAIGYAVTLMHRRTQSPNASRKDQRLFWTWALEWLKTKKWLYSSGDANRLREIRVFIAERERTEMGGEDLKSQYLELKDWAEKESKK